MNNFIDVHHAFSFNLEDQMVDRYEGPCSTYTSTGREGWLTMKKHTFVCLVIMSVLYVCLPAVYYSWRVTRVLVYVLSHHMSEVNEKFSALWNSMIWPCSEVELPYIACLCCFHLFVTLYKL